MLDCKSPFEITHIRLLQQLSLMQTRLLKSSAKTCSNIINEGICDLSFFVRLVFQLVQFFIVNKRELPVGQMKNYQENLKKINPL